MEINKARPLEKALAKRLASTVESIKEIVDEYAVAEAFIIGAIHRSISNDFLYFLFTKSCKSLISIEVLLKKGLPEDALVLIRTILENYIAFSHLLYHPGSIEDFVQNKLRVHVGDYKHPKNNRGYTDYKRIIKEDGAVVRFGFSAKELSKLTRHDSDNVTFDYFYQFLSELTHPHFIASGNYRTGAKYTYSDSSNNLQTYFFAVYLSTKLVYEWMAYEGIQIKEERGLKLEMRRNCRSLKRAMQKGMFEEDDKRYLDAINSMIEIIEDGCG